MLCANDIGSLLGVTTSTVHTLAYKEENYVNCMHFPNILKRVPKIKSVVDLVHFTTNYTSSRV